MIANSLQRWLPRQDKPNDKIQEVRLCDGGLAVTLAGVKVSDLAMQLRDGERLIHHDRSECTVHLPIALPLRGGRRLVTAGARSSAAPDNKLIAALRRAHAMVGRERGMPIIQAAPVSPYDRKILRLAFLAPDIQRDILAGRQPHDLNLEKLVQMTIPLTWSEQRRSLGWPNRN